jgi:hypothetical protein
MCGSKSERYPESEVHTITPTKKKSSKADNITRKTRPKEKSLNVL